MHEQHSLHQKIPLRDRVELILLEEYQKEREVHLTTHGEKYPFRKVLYEQSYISHSVVRTCLLRLHLHYPELQLLPFNQISTPAQLRVSKFSSLRLVNRTIHEQDQNKDQSLPVPSGVHQKELPCHKYQKLSSRLLSLRHEQTPGELHLEQKQYRTQQQDQRSFTPFPCQKQLQ